MTRIEKEIARAIADHLIAHGRQNLCLGTDAGLIKLGEPYVMHTGAGVPRLGATMVLSSIMDLNGDENGTEYEISIEVRTTKKGDGKPR